MPKQIIGKSVIIFEKLKKDFEELEAKILLRQVVTLGRPHFAELYNKIELLLNHLNEIYLEIKTFKKFNMPKIISKIIKLKNNYEKPSEKKKRILQENIKRVKKLNKLKNRI